MTLNRISTRAVLYIKMSIVAPGVPFAIFPPCHSKYFYIEGDEHYITPAIEVDGELIPDPDSQQLLHPDVTPSWLTEAEANHFTYNLGYISLDAPIVLTGSPAIGTFDVSPDFYFPSVGELLLIDKEYELSLIEHFGAGNVPSNYRRTPFLCQSSFSRRGYPKQQSVGSVDDYDFLYWYLEAFSQGGSSRISEVVNIDAPERFFCSGASIVAVEDSNYSLGSAHYFLSNIAYNPPDLIIGYVSYATLQSFTADILGRDVTIFGQTAMGNNLQHYLQSPPPLIQEFGFLDYSIGGRITEVGVDSFDPDVFAS